jgi:hypothetical protein
MCVRHGGIQCAKALLRQSGGSAERKPVWTLEGEVQSIPGETPQLKGSMAWMMPKESAARKPEKIII